MKKIETKKCPICKEIFHIPLHYKRLKRGFYCSSKCWGISKKGKPTWNKGKKCPQFSGKNHPRWKGGTYLNTKGYVFVKNDKHPFCNRQGYIFKHRLVMEKHIGRFLNPEEQVHHLNNNHSDNRLCNLKLFKNNSEHMKYHHSL